MTKGVGCALAVSWLLWPAARALPPDAEIELAEASLLAVAASHPAAQVGFRGMPLAQNDPAPAPVAPPVDTRPAPALPDPGANAVEPPINLDPTPTTPADSSLFPKTRPQQFLPTVPGPLTNEPSAVKPEQLPAPNPEEHRFLISKIKYRYGAAGSKPHPELPPIEKILGGQVTLGRLKDGLVAAARSDEQETVSVQGGSRRYYYGDALLALSNQVVSNLNQKFGIYGVYVTPDAAQIGDNLEDKRRSKSHELTMGIYVSEIADVRTVARKVPFKPKDEPKIDGQDEARIRLHSPVHAGSLFEKAVLQSYLDRVNRFPSRHVDASLNSSADPGKVTLDLLVREQKPFSMFAQVSNTGTENTGEWRSRAGVEYKQLLNLDDTLRLEYGTSDLKRYESASGSFEFTPLFPDYLKLKAYASWSRYSAADLGEQLVDFSGESITGGAVATWTPLYVRGFPLDIYTGAELMSASVTNTSVGEGGTNFFLLYAGLGTDKTTDVFTLAVNLEGQANLAGLAGTDTGSALDILGRANTDNDFFIGKINLLFSFYLEPLLFGKQWDDQKVWWKSTRAHEIFTSVRGQFAFGARLAPQLQFVAGGLSTVRGYPESYTSGDNAIVGTFEYRFHVPRVLFPRALMPVKDPAGESHLDNADARERSRSRFNLRPATIGAGPDWDLIVRYFLDVGRTVNNSPFPYEQDATMLGTGIGLELQILRPFLISFRVDWGFALLSVDRPTNAVAQGSSRVNLSVSLAW